MVKLIKFFLVLTGFATANGLAQSSLQKELDKAVRMPGKEISELQKESAKTKALIRECFDFCRPNKVDGYKVENLADCKIPANIIFAKDEYFCQSDVVARIKLYTVIKNRFGEERSEVSTCGWITHDYIIDAVCGKSSRRTLELNNRKEADPEFLVPRRMFDILPNQ